VGRFASLRHFGSLRALARASFHELRQFLPRRKAEAVVAALSMSVLAEAEHARSELLDNPESIHRACADEAQRWTRASWLIGGAVAMGISIWSMHYTGMLAFRLPIPMEYDWPTAFLSYLTSFCTSALGLFVVSRRKMGFVRAFTASIFMGGGVAAMHYTAMESMRLRAVCRYSPALVTISVVLAIVFSLMSLWLTFLFREEALGQFLRKVASAVLLGAAIAVMHYTGMASASFIPCAEFPDLSHALPISALGIPGIAVVNLMIVVVVLLTSLADRLQKQKALLDELFEQAPQAVALNGSGPSDLASQSGVLSGVWL
jgi:NO-binding membrane sensor protein with MHYT domain